MEVRLIFTTASGKRRALTRTLPLVIGRSSGADLKIPGTWEHVSRRHCEVLCDPEGRVCVRDLHSTNGTFVAGHQLAPEAVTPTKSGAGIRLGDISFRVVYPVVAAAAGVAPAQDAGAVADLHAGEAAGMALDATEPLGERQQRDVESSRADERPAAGPEAEEVLAADEFGFLAAAEPAAADWPEADEEPSTAGDDKLDDFFKGLS